MNGSQQGVLSNYLVLCRSVQIGSRIHEAGNRKLNRTRNEANNRLEEELIQTKELEYGIIGGITFSLCCNSFCH